MTKKKVGGYGNIKPEDGKQFSKDYQPDKEVWTEKKSIEMLNELIDWLELADENIFFNEFLYLEYRKNHPELNRQTFDELPSYLDKKYTSCSKLLNVAKKIQETKLIKFGVFDKLNATMTKFVLINHHGYTERSEVDNKSSDGSMSPTAPKTLAEWYDKNRSKKKNDAG